MNINLKPKKRSRLRLLLGKTYYTLKRYLLWISPKYKFAKKKVNENLKYKCYEDKSILLRNLRDVDIEDILGRDPVVLDNKKIHPCFQGRILSPWCHLSSPAFHNIGLHKYR